MTAAKASSPRPARAGAAVPDKVPSSRSPRKGAATKRIAVAPRDRFLATPAARRVRDDIVERLRAFACTSHGRSRLGELEPAADPAQALSLARAIEEDRRRVAALDADAVARHLRRVHAPIDPPPVRQMDVLVVCESEALRLELQAAGLDRWADLAGPDALAQAQEAGLVVVVYEEGREVPDLEAIVEVPATSPPAAILPETALCWARANRGLLEACQALGQLIGKPSRAGEALAALQAIGQKPADPTRLPQAIQEVRGLLDQQVRHASAALSLRGDEVLQAMGSRWPAPLKAVLDQALRDGREMLKARTGCDLQAFLPGFPITVDEEEVASYVQHALGQARVQRFQAEVRAATTIEALRKALEAEALSWLEFDVRFALGRFAQHHGLRPATFGSTLRFGSSVHLALASDPTAQRIAYELGGPHPVAILTGANSGGKTTLLEHVAQLAIMARLGLPVVGEGVIVPWVEEVHLVAGKRAVDAGAFESFLRTFLPVTAPGPARLVLADEVEAMTELEAATRILAFLVDRLAASGSLAILVSHLAGAILSRVRHPGVRTDGIQATGLDASFRLVVDRTPRMGALARSTPELIVERLTHTTRGAPQELFCDLLAAMRGDPAPSVLDAQRRGRVRPAAQIAPAASDAAA